MNENFKFEHSPFSNRILRQCRSQYRDNSYGVKISAENIVSQTLSMPYEKSLNEPFNPISTGGGGVFSTTCPVNGSELHNGTS